MKRLILVLVFLLAMGMVLAACVTEENKVTKNGVSFPNYCQDESNLVKNYCLNDSVEQDVMGCDCQDDICGSVPVENQTVVENQSVNETVACEELWQCTEWSACDGLRRERTCADLNSCNNLEGKPSEVQGCLLPVIPWYNTWKGVVLILVLVAGAVIGGYFLLKKKEEVEG